MIVCACRLHCLTLLLPLCWYCERAICLLATQRCMTIPLYLIGPTVFVSGRLEDSPSDLPCAK